MLLLAFGVGGKHLQGLGVGAGEALDVTAHGGLLRDRAGVRVGPRHGHAVRGERAFAHRLHQVDREALEVLIG